MIEAKYYRDYGHNYMILQCRQQETVRSYQYKILTSGKIEEILKCSVRYINGSTYYYYDISSRTTLDSMYRDRKISYEQIKDIFHQIHRIYEKLAGYFMEEAGLVLLPEHIYYNITDKKYIGLYYPDYQMQPSDTYRSLMDFLLEHIDTDDRVLAEKMYRICEMAEDNSFFIEDALQILDDSDESNRSTVQEPAQEIMQEPFREMIQKPTQEGDREPAIAPKEYLDAVQNLKEQGRYNQVSSKRNIFYVIFSVLSVLSMAGEMAVCNIYELTQREEIILYGTMAATGVCLLLCIAGIFTDRKRKALPKRNFDDEVIEDDCSADTNIASLDKVISRDMNLEMVGYMPEAAGTAHEGSRPFRTESHMMQENDDFGSTVFFDDRVVEEHKLYATDRRNKRHIELKQFPCTIGKMAGCVDYVLPDDSVSRIHARFDVQGEKVLMTDMNSTNGTFKNGLRMQPQETVEIEPGDEVRFGNLNYCYR